MSMIGNLVAVSPSQLQRLIEEPSALPAFLYPDDGREHPSDHFDLEKAWHGIHFLLTGETWGGDLPLADAVLGGTEIGEDLGYGPARFVTSEEVKATAEAIAGISRQELEGRYSPGALEKAEIYPTGIWEREGPDALAYLLQYYEPLVSFYKEAAARGDAVIQFLD